MIQNGILLKGIDGASFRSLSKSPREIFFKDKKTVYVEKFGKLKKIDNADPETFKKIGFAYAKDKNRFFMRMSNSLIYPKIIRLMYAVFCTMML
ncbi:DKNYY domain protein [Leptospira weilii str. UI 13098]|uniref:DKNYY domain protein n=2 Tax=Leptospira weilii TaxID=28184 RepID=M6QES4_9LEPT|nr:DKNYY domain protein [Leptospira weilii str. UI 13098]